MAQIRNSTTLYSASAAGTGDWFSTTNGKYDEGKDYSISFAITAGDTIRIEVTNDSAETVISATEEFTSVTGALGTVIKGTWDKIRAVKTGTAGTATVIAKV